MAENIGSLPAKSHTLFCHILNAHHIWNQRILNATTHFQPWDEYSVTAFAALQTENQRISEEILATNEITRVFAYQNTKCEKFENTIQDTLFHIINHSTYHRAQLATDCRANGIAPISTDYIFYRR